MSNLINLEDLNEFKNQMFNAIYPVGSIYMSIKSAATFDPNTVFPGTWVQIEDRFLLAAGSSYTVGDTGGEATHTLTMGEMPAHSHRDLSKSWNTGSIETNLYKGGVARRLITNTSGGNNGIYISEGSLTRVDNATGGPFLEVFTNGSNQPHNNMPPYQVVTIWKRTA